MPILVRLTALGMRALRSQLPCQACPLNKGEMELRGPAFPALGLGGPIHPHSPGPGPAYLHPADRKPTCSARAWEKWVEREPKISICSTLLHGSTGPAVDPHCPESSRGASIRGEGGSLQGGGREGAFCCHLTSGLPKPRFYCFLLTPAYEDDTLATFPER